MDNVPVSSIVAARVEHMCTYACVLLIKHTPLEGYAGVYIGMACICVQQCEFSEELCPQFVIVTKNLARQWKYVHPCSHGILCTIMYPLCILLPSLAAILFHRVST